MNRTFSGPHSFYRAQGFLLGLRRTVFVQTRVVFARGRLTSRCFRGWRAVNGGANSFRQAWRNLSPSLLLQRV